MNEPTITLVLPLPWVLLTLAALCLAWSFVRFVGLVICLAISSANHLHRLAESARFIEMGLNGLTSAIGQHGSTTRPLNRQRFAE